MKKTLFLTLLVLCATFTVQAQSNVRYSTSSIINNTQQCFESASLTGPDVCINRSGTNGVLKVTDGLGNAGSFIVATQTDGYIQLSPGACTWKTSGTAGATNNTIVPDGASNTPVMQGSATAAGASNNTLTCVLNLPTRITAAKGVTLLDVTVPYGVQTTALTSLGAPTISTIAFPVAGASETASTVTPVTAGAVTVTPVVGSANLGLTTAGAYFTEKVALNAPVAINTDLQEVVFQQVFAQSASAAQLVSTPGLIVHYKIDPL